MDPRKTRDLPDLMSDEKIQFVEVAPASALSRARSSRLLQHPFFAWAGLRPPIAQHTSREHAALEKHARGRMSLVEIGVAEGVSALALRTVMDPNGTLYLIDPFHLSRVRPLNFLRRAAHRTVSGGSRKRIVWIESFSQDAILDWNTSIDFLLIDGDHEESAVERDWNDWQPHLTAGGIVAFHDARLFPGGWTTPDYGPIRFVDRVFRSDSDSRWAILDEVDSLVVVARRDRAAA